jgi:hypothetical protein
MLEVGRLPPRVHKYPTVIKYVQKVR